MPLRQIIRGSDYSCSVKNYGGRNKSLLKQKNETNHQFARFLAVSPGMHFQYLGGIIV